ncbi:MAG: hypothetical protein ABIN48_02790 [Ginsengibacter sp.]
MNKLLLVLFFLVSMKTFGQLDATKWVRAFPITDYILDVSDSVKLVQVHLPEGVAFAEKQAGLLKGIYQDKHFDTMAIGAGKCHLIKGDYYYFTINYKQSGKLPREGDLIYTLMPKTPVYWRRTVLLASLFIGLQDVYGNPLYDRYAVFSQWTKSDEEALIDSLVSDIHFTGNYFLKNDPDMNEKIKSGKNQGKLVLNTMIACGKQNVIDFLEYIIAKPGLYAGQEWKISEIFASWLKEGAPIITKTE